MYVCNVCDCCVGPNIPLYKHILYRQVPAQSLLVRGVEQGRTRSEVERELPVCKDCLSILQEGHSLRAAKLLGGKKPAKPQTVQEVLPTTTAIKPGKYRMPVVGRGKIISNGRSTSEGVKDSKNEAS